MHAIIRVGGKQFTVKAGDRIRVEKLEQDLGSKFDIKEVLFVGGEGQSLFGQPTVSGAKVTAVVTNQDRDKKVIVFKKKRRKGYRKTQGHRQWFTELFIQEILVGGQSSQAESKAHVIDPAKREARLAAQHAEIAKAHAGNKGAQKKALKEAKRAVVEKKAAHKAKKSAAPKKKSAGTKKPGAAKKKATKKTKKA